ncbi:MAG: hypothetical protein FIA99_07720 [Ruminiclostridium sp.]|nr:hypothetical protein [Ruminiclostridium sp.]
MPEKNKGKRLKTGGMLLILFSLLYIPSLFHWLSSDNVSSDILRIGIIEDSVNAEGLLVRDEVLLDPSATDGKLIPEVSEGERIPAFGRVATISNKASLSLLKELEDINTQIIQAQTERAKKTDFFSEDIAKIDKSIGQKVQGIINLYNINSMAGIGQLTLEVDRLIEKKAAIAGEGDGDSHIKSLKQEKESIQQRINSNTSQIISQYSGIISFIIDGYEQILTPKSLKELTPEIIKSVNSEKLQKISSYEEVNTGKPFMKVIKGNYTYIAAVLEPEKAGMFKAGESIDVRLNAVGAVVAGYVTDLTKKNGGKYLITVRVDRFSGELSSMRKINVDFIKDSYEGLKIPLKSLYSPDAGWKKARVMLIKANSVTAREVDVLCKDEEYAIIGTPENEVKKTVNLYDTYILNPENIKEGQIVLQ